MVRSGEVASLFSRSAENLLVKPQVGPEFLRMQTQRIIATAASLASFAALAPHASAQDEFQDVFMGLGADQRYYQESALRVLFDQGELNLLLRDGRIILDGACVVDPQLFAFPPSDIPPCPLGATGFVAAGDIDRDGVRDDNQYWSVLTIVPNVLVEPSRPELVQLDSAPPSKLPRPLQNFRDDSVVTFYNIRQPGNVRQYDQTRYEFVRPYGAVPQVETAVALGTMTEGGTMEVTITGSAIAGSPVVIPVDVEAFQDAAQWAESVRQSIGDNAAVTAAYTVGGGGANIVLTQRNRSGNDPTLNIAMAPGTAFGPGLPAPVSLNTVAGTQIATPGGAQQQMADEIVSGQYTFLFPRLGNPDLTPVAIPVNITPYIEAYGFGRNGRAGFRFTSGNWDSGYYQMDPRQITQINWQGNTRGLTRPGDSIYFSILNEAEDFLTFPPTIPQSPVLLPSPVQQSYTMPPFFYEVGDEGVMNLQFQRLLPSNGIAYDNSFRQFRAKIRMVDSYLGYARITMPLGTSKRDLSPKGNLDRDSMSNIEEFAFQFPTNEDINASAKEQFVPGDVFFFLGEPAVQEFNRVVTKVENPILDPQLQPAGPGPTELDGTDRIYFEAPFRPRTGNTLKYSFVEVVTAKNGKKKPRKIQNLNQNWTVGFREEASVIEDLIIEVKIVHAVTRDVLAIQQLGEPMDVNLTQQFITLTSNDPVADPLAPLPDLGVVVTPVTLK